MLADDMFKHLGYERSNGEFPVQVCYRKCMYGELFKQINIVKEHGAAVSYERLDVSQKAGFTKEEIQAVAQFFTESSGGSSVQQKKGQWKPLGKGIYYCTECGYVHPAIEHLPKFCEDCGATMNEENNT